MSEDDKLLNVLIVEDEKNFMQIAVQMLSNYTRFQAENAKKAREIFNKVNPDVVFLDISLPDGDGMELLKEFKLQKSNCYIVMLTGSSVLKDVKRAIELGANDYIIKPFSRQKLKQCIDKYYKFQQV